MFFRSLLLSFTLLSSAQAHFLTLLPENDVVTSKKSQNIEAMFIHPFEQTGMKMERPKSIKIYGNGKTKDLQLTMTKRFGKEAWKGKFQVKRPGDHIIYLEPKEYFEPAEGKFIRHITKTVVNGYGLENGWDKKIGLDMEVIPMVKPYGLYKGNTFTAQVLHHGEPAKNIEVEVELFNTQGLKAPTDAHTTQVVKTDPNGIFHYTFPFKGWWGFAALVEEGVLKHKDGKNYPIEVGGLIWVKVY